MKKILLILCITLLLASVAMARQGEGVHEPGTGIENPELKAAGSGQGMDDNLDNEDDDLMDDDEDKTDSTENKQVQKQVRSEVQSQNRVRDAVKSLLTMENREGGIGKQVSAIAKDFNNSLKATTNSEEKIAKRSKFKRMFAGGDEEAAKEIEEKVKSNKEKIEQLKVLTEEATEEEKAIMEEQITAMEQEQTRLNNVATKEKKSKGLFGWIWK